MHIILEWLWTFVFCAIQMFIPSMMCVVMTLCYPVLYPISSYWFARVCTHMGDHLWRHMAAGIETYCGGKLIFYGDHIPNRENAIVTSNHRSLIDWMFFFGIAGRRGRLGNLKFFAKDAVKYVPGFGWGIYFLDAIFLKRNWDADKDRIVQTFSTIQNRGLPYWMVTFLEGTRATPKKIEESQAYCKSKGLPVLRHVLYPRVKGFIATLEGLRGTADAVYDITIGVPGNKSIDLRDVACGRLTPLHIHIRRFPFHEIPTEKDAIIKWVEAIYVKKDEMLDEFYKTEKFPDPAPEEWSFPYEHVEMELDKYREFHNKRVQQKKNE